MKGSFVFACWTMLAAGAAEAQTYGNGADGPLNVASTTVLNPAAGILISGTGTLGATTIKVDSLGGGPWAVGNEALVITTSGDPSIVGQHEFKRITSVVVGPGIDLGIDPPLTQAYPSTPLGSTIVIKVPNCTDIAIDPGQTLSPANSILALRASGTATIAGTLSASGVGAGGGWSSPSFTTGYSPISGGGGAGGTDATIPSGAGGGAYGTTGSDGEQTISGGFPVDPGLGGAAYGSADLGAGIFLGAGGGLGAKGTLGTRPTGGRGGGIVLLYASSLAISGTVEANGLNGGNGSGSVSNTASGAGGGAGGTIWIVTDALSGSGTVEAQGGLGGDAGTGVATTGAGGDGGGGRIRIDTPTGSAGSLTLLGGSSHLGLSTTTAVDDWSAFQ